MCGRTVLSLNKDQVQCACSYKPRGKEIFIKPAWLHEHNGGMEYAPSYNIAPTEITPVLVSASKYKNVTECSRVLKPMMWGIIPPWHKGDYRTHNLSTNNCRLENITSSKLYTPILKNGGRCIIVVEGFYEWQTSKSSKIKQPHFFYVPHDDIKIDEPQNSTFSAENGWKGRSLLHMAGLYNVWQDNNTIIYSYSVITMESNDTMSWLHHRMPAVLETEEQIEAWLDIDNVNPEMAVSYLRPVNVLSSHPVATAVNNSKFKSKSCIKRLTTLCTWLSETKKRKSSDELSSVAKKKKTDGGSPK